MTPDFKGNKARHLLLLGRQAPKATRVTLDFKGNKARHLLLLGR